MTNVEKAIKNAQKESKKGELVAKVLFSVAKKNLDKEFDEKTFDPIYQKQLSILNKQLEENTQKVKMAYFDNVLKVNPGLTVVADNLKQTEVQEKHLQMEQSKNPGIVIKKIDKQIRELMQDDSPYENAWKYGIDVYKNQVRVVLELSNTSPETIEKIQSQSDVEVQDDNLIQITTDVKNIPRINSFQEVATIRPVSKPSYDTGDTFGVVKSPFLNSDQIIKTLGDMKYSNLIQLSADVSDLNLLTKADFKYPISEGVYAINADLVQTSGITGKDVKVAVLDVMFDTNNPKISDNIIDFKSFRNSLENSMLEQSVTHGENISHGTAVAEIITDVAPNSKLYLYEMSTDVEFGRAIDEAVSNNVDVIAMAAGWPNLSTDGTSHITKKVEDAVNHGISVIVPSGNFAQKHWKGYFSDNDLNAWHAFAENDEGLSIIVSESQTKNRVPIMIYLNWNDGLGDFSDFDLVLVDPLGKIVDYSANTQTSKSQKTENIFYVPQMAGLYTLGISYAGAFKSLDDVHSYSELELFSVNNNIEYPIAASSAVVPSDANGVIVVGAVSNKDGILESFSSQGPTNNGKTVPNVVGPNGVTTIAYNGNLFYGTSATTPYVAGIAALMLDANPNLSPSQLLNEIEQHAKPNHMQPNYQNEYGFGMVDATFIVDKN
ncbi:Subtilisin-like serine protease [Candidatus Nitrosarchaeum limnium SFB1]|uniref:Subtilisin-like serine protease n=1 Tax=Candidatus Nitrosarchaeum limnium SFB1 TaxID=886738 RepID=F3KI79_9ARCH|nr:Subtilisin-like serine protease [Candidatus Nitrosarchaeum limnium SFB1]